jgi:hypothetical protein
MYRRFSEFTEHPTRYLANSLQKTTRCFKAVRPATVVLQAKRIYGYFPKLQGKYIFFIHSSIEVLQQNYQTKRPVRLDTKLEIMAKYES